ncbi:MAG: PHP domain-containing protein [Vulcanimicrobiaceae bacterium]
MLVDFHSHTLESDGTLAPAELAAAMQKRGVGIFSVTDHDSLGAYGKFEDAVGAATVVTGIELNTTYRGQEVHVLGYGFPVDCVEMTAAIAANRDERETRAEQMVDQLCRAGYPIEMADVRAECGHASSTIGRPHVARALIRKGLVADINSAFRNLLTAGKPGYVPSTYMGPHRAVELIARSGGVAVLAHPGRLKDEAVIDELVVAGLAGIETFYPTHEPAQVAHFRAIATHHGLVMTAGSDFHDIRYNARGVGMEVERDDIAGFLELVMPATV